MKIESITEFNLKTNNPELTKKVIDFILSLPEEERNSLYFTTTTDVFYEPNETTTKQLLKG